MNTSMHVGKSTCLGRTELTCRNSAMDFSFFFVSIRSHLAVHLLIKVWAGLAIFEWGGGFFSFASPFSQFALFGVPFASFLWSFCIVLWLFDCSNEKRSLHSLYLEGKLTT